ncbi:MAG: helix-turn-helix domain-containing protein [Caulobacteraceae bacterium]|nr:helix-turn-helix domain-containing protein [Caulobacteraceae bacterium]
MKTPVTLDPYVIASLLPDLVGHDRHPSAFLTYVVIAAEAGGGWAALSHAQLAERTGLSRRAIQLAVARLARRGLVDVRRDGPTDTSRYRALSPWRRDRSE